MIFYQRIRDLREDEDMSQDDVCKALKLHKTTYCRYEQGITRIPLDFAVQIAIFYNVSLDYITGLTNKKHSYKEWK